ncbi:MAG TPA: rod shape-determining protein RodA [Gemmatimonadaceae bacterium]|nr:rod shape-determining protein RodA [Gemmatimonadaceae bacterium]
MRRIIGDVPLLLIATTLSLYGVAMVYSAGVTDTPTFVHNLYRSQSVWLLIGLGGAYAISRSSVRFVEWATLPAYLLTLFVLCLTLVIGKGGGTAASSKSWIAIGGHRLGQPSELMKLTVVLMLAKVLASRPESPNSLADLWKPILTVGIPWIVIMLQPDLGTGLVFIGIFFVMLFWAGTPWPLLVLLASPVISLVLSFSTTLWGAWFFVLLALVLRYRPYLFEGISLLVINIVVGVFAPVVWERLAPYQRNRLLVFLDPSVDPRNAGYHVIQSKVAIGSGGLFGSGFLAGPQKRLAFLPEQHTDFIFAVVGEELGFIGVTVALALFLMLFLRITNIAERANESYSSLVAFGLMGCWLVHIVVNVGMTLNLMPITGIPLPFFSYGGSFMLASWLAIGILMRISYEGRGVPRAAI